MLRLAFDIGGTFTDFVLHDSERDSMRLWKVPTSSSAPADAVVTAISELLSEGSIKAGDVGAILHATTVATNAILERRGAKTALITTRGFRDIALLGRQKRPNTNDFNLAKQRPLVERANIFEITERLEANGDVNIPLDLGEMDALIEKVKKGGFEAVSVLFLHSYANPKHEQAVGERIRAACPHLQVSLSSDVSPKYREYERVTTTTANAYIQPIVHQYLEGLETSLSDQGLTADLQIMQSNGGLVSPGIARAFPVRIVESGPAAGVLMCGQIGREENIDHILTFDMGGTTAKMGAIDFGEPIVVPTFEVDAINFRKGSGLPLNITAIELLEIGAGGGSIAAVNMGLISVGPRSAGAVPGPICYGKGGTLPTVTDANLVLGYLNPAFFNGGAMGLDLDAAGSGIEMQVAKKLGLTTIEAAWGIHSVANSNMERAMRVVSVERGRDPRTHTMIAFGGAGPLHAARLARALGIPRVLVPFGAGVGSALGLLTADQKLDNSLTHVLPLSIGAVADIAAVFDDLEKRLNEELRYIDTTHGAMTWRRGCSMRYSGQGYELRVELPNGPIDAAFLETARKAFEDAYCAHYGYVDGGAAIEGIDWHLMAVIASDSRVSISSGKAVTNNKAESRATRKAYFPEAGGFVDTPIVDRYGMRPGERLAGPALVEERESTTVMLPGDVAEVTTTGHLMLDINTERAT
jgi:N-methylhydantoinase A